VTVSEALVRVGFAVPAVREDGVPIDRLVAFRACGRNCQLSVGFTASAEQRLSTSLNERCSCFLVMLFRLPQNLLEVRSTAQVFQPRISRERDSGRISAVDGVCQKLHGPIFSAEMGQLSRKVVNAFRVA
jgi:hypothetical protein